MGNAELQSHHTKSNMTTPASAFQPRRPTPPDQATTNDLDPSAPRPISLQSPGDLLHLRAVALQAARQKIDLHLPPNAEAASTSPDGLRKTVEQLVDRFINETFLAARSNVEINGIPGPEAVNWDAKGQNSGEEYEVFDAKLAGRIKDLHGKIEKLNLAVADRRREAVRVQAEKFKQGFGTLDEQMSRLEDEDVHAEPEISLEVDERLKGREETTKESWERAIQALSDVSEGRLKDATDRADEARKVVDALDTT